VIKWPRDGASSARCKQCRAEVWWAHKPGGGWHRPLERTCIETITVTEGVAHLTDVPMYQVHRCDPQVLDEVAQDQARYFPGSGHLLTEVAVPCSRCAAEVGETCRTLSDSHRQKYGDHLRVAHPARVRDALVHTKTDAHPSGA
jgi:hypothetical protein